MMENWSFPGFQNREFGHFYPKIQPDLANPANGRVPTYSLIKSKKKGGTQYLYRAKERTRADSPHPLYRIRNQILPKLVVLRPLDNIVHINRFNGDENVRLGCCGR